MRLVLYHTLTFVAFTISACLWLDGMHAQGVMCAPQAACAQVAKSAFGNIAGIPLSFLGTFGFGVIGLASVSSIPVIRRLGRWLSVGAALCAVGLIAVQFFVLSAICPWCLAIDLAAVVSGMIAWDSRSEAAVISRFSWQSWVVADDLHSRQGLPRQSLMLSRGMPVAEFFRSLLGRAGSHSTGRQMSAHLSAPRLKITSLVSPVGNNALQVVSVAAAIKDQPWRLCPPFLRPAVRFGMITRSQEFPLFQQPVYCQDLLPKRSRQQFYAGKQGWKAPEHP